MDHVHSRCHFQINTPLCLNQFRHPAIIRPGTNIHIVSMRTSCKMNLSDRESANDGDDDDGWGNNEVGSNSDSSIEKQSDRNRELTMLQEDIANKREGRKALDSATAKVHGEEKDLFIPIVTLVAVIGFAGLYGYEMVRLYARGELYLPWDR